MMNPSTIELPPYLNTTQRTMQSPRDYYQHCDCTDAKCNPDSRHCALHPFANHAVWKAWKEDEQTVEWSASRNVKINIFLGSGQIRNPYTTKYETFETHCEMIGFSPQFLRQLRSKQPFYECTIHRNDDKKPMILELAISVYETDSMFILV